MVVQEKNRNEVTFVCSAAPQVRNVYVAGEFNGWNPTTNPMFRDKDGAFKARMSLAPGEYQYKFVADGVWFSDSSAEGEIMNPFGTFNSVVRVASNRRSPAEAAPAGAAVKAPVEQERRKAAPGGKGNAKAAARRPVTAARRRKNG